MLVRTLPYPLALCVALRQRRTAAGRNTGYYLGREAALIVFLALGGLTQAIRERICAATGEVRAAHTSDPRPYPLVLMPPARGPYAVAPRG